MHWIAGSFQVFQDETGKPHRLTGVNMDISARKQADEERQKFLSLADSSQEFIGMCDGDFKPFYINAAGQHLIGFESLQTACQVNVREYFFPEDQSFVMNEFFPSVLREGSGEVEIRFRHFRTGEAIWMLYNVFTIKDERGTIAGWATVSRNIHDRKRVEESLKRVNADLGRGMHNLPMPTANCGQRRKKIEAFVYSVSHDLRSPLVNLQGFGKRMDRSAQDLRGLLVDSGLPPLVRDRGLEILDKPIATSVRFIRTAVGRLSNIIDALLRLSRAGKVIYRTGMSTSRPSLRGSLSR